MTRSASRLPDILKRNDADILRDWVKEQLATLRPEAMSESALREQTQRFFGILRDAVQSGELGDITGPACLSRRVSLLPHGILTFSLMNRVGPWLAGVRSW